LSFEVEFGQRGGVEYARTVPMFAQLLDMRLESDTEKANAAASFVRSLVTALAERACDTAESADILQIGLTGGVTYSNPIASWVERTVRARELEFLTHERVPNGDGGISVGQNAIVGAMLG